MSGYAPSVSDHASEHFSHYIHEIPKETTKSSAKAFFRGFTGIVMATGNPVKAVIHGAIWASTYAIYGLAIPIFKSLEVGKFSTLAVGAACFGLAGALSVKAVYVLAGLPMVLNQVAYYGLTVGVVEGVSRICDQIF